MARPKGSLNEDNREPAAYAAKVIRERPSIGTTDLMDKVLEEFPKASQDPRWYRKLIKELAPTDPSGPWSLAASPQDVDAALVLPVIAYWAGRLVVTNDQARWITRLGRIYDDIPPHDMLWLAHAYARGSSPDADMGVILGGSQLDMRDLDLLVAFTPWRDEAKAYTEAVRRGDVDWLRIPFPFTGRLDRALMEVFREKRRERFGV